MFYLLQINSHQMLEKVKGINKRSKNHCKRSNKTINYKISKFISSANPIRLRIHPHHREFMKYHFSVNKWPHYYFP